MGHQAEPNPRVRADNKTLDTPLLGGKGWFWTLFVVDTLTSLSGIHLRLWSTMQRSRGGAQTRNERAPPNTAGRQKHQIDTTTEMPCA